MQTTTLALFEKVSVARSFKVGVITSAVADFRGKDSSYV